MSLNYTHLLIPVSPQYRPEPGAVAEFVQGIVDNGNVPNPSQISFSRVTREEGRVRPTRNMVTGETINLPQPSRRAEKPQILARAAQIIESAGSQREYNVAISGEGIPSNPPCEIGYVETETWERFTEPYHLQVRCCVRGSIVRLYHLASEEELDRPMDFTKYRPMLDEDCPADEREGIFVHPEIGAFRIPNAGCGTFRMEFNFGKFLFPRLRNETVDVLDDSVVSLARKIFGVEFVQACHWG